MLTGVRVILGLLFTYFTQNLHPLKLKRFFKIVIMMMVMIIFAHI